MLKKNMRAAVNYEDVEAVPYKKTLAFVNNFIINTTQFLNRFSYLAEQKLADVGKDIQRLEITMQILETKLASIPGLEDVKAAAPAAGEGATVAAPTGEGPAAPTSAGPAAPPLPGATTTTTTTPSAPTPTPKAADDEDDFDTDSDEESAPAPAPAGEPAEEEEAAPAGGGMTMQQDPRYERYFKMMKLGVPAPSIKQKMMMEGVNPDILDTPNAPSDFQAPGGGGGGGGGDGGGGEAEEDWDSDE